MRGTLTALPSISARGREGAANREASIREWRTFCGEVREAADQLRQIAARAEFTARSVEFDTLRQGFGIPTPSATSPNADTYATMMLGPFAALEALRRQIRD